MCAHDPLSNIKAKNAPSATLSASPTFLKVPSSLFLEQLLSFYPSFNTGERWDVGSAPVIFCCSFMSHLSLHTVPEGELTHTHSFSDRRSALG